MTVEQRNHLRRIVESFAAEASAKYERGQHEHGGNLWEKPRLLDFAIEEAIDQVVYLYTLREQQRGPNARPVIYVAGPFRGASAWDIEENIRRAERLALDVWRLGAACVCPHTNTRFFQGAAPDTVWLEGDLAILARCDAVLLTEDWERSAGARAERDFAVAHEIPVLDSLTALRGWLPSLHRAEIPAGMQSERMGDAVV